MCTSKTIKYNINKMCPDTLVNIDKYNIDRIKLYT